MPKALEMTRDIVVAAFQSVSCNNFVLYDETGKNTADFFEAIYNKVKEIEGKEINE